MTDAGDQSGGDSAPDSDDEPRSSALPNFTGVSLSVGAFLAGLEQKILHNRPPAAIVVEEQQHAANMTVDGVTLHLPDDPIERPEPPDTSGARL